MLFKENTFKTLPGEKPTLINTALSKLILNFRSF